MAVQTLSEALSYGWHVNARCAAGNFAGFKTDDVFDSGVGVYRAATRAMNLQVSYSNHRVVREVDFRSI
jgi:hypothetical protein